MAIFLNKRKKSSWQSPMKLLGQSSPQLQYTENTHSTKNQTKQTWAIFFWPMSRYSLHVFPGIIQLRLRSIRPGRAAVNIEKKGAIFNENSKEAKGDQGNQRPLPPEQTQTIHTHSTFIIIFFSPVYNRLMDISGVKVGGIHPKNAIFRETREEKRVNITTTLLEKSEKRAQI